MTKQIITAAQRPAALVQAEAELAEADGACRTISTRIGAIDIDVGIESPLRKLTISHRDELLAERAELMVQFTEIGENQRRLSERVKELKAEFGAVLASELIPPRRVAARRLLAAIGEVDAALAELSSSSNALRAHGARTKEVVRPLLLDDARRTAELIASNGGVTAPVAPREAA
jgi:hypothetical protein